MKLESKIFDYKKIFCDVDLDKIDVVYSDFVGVPFYYPYVFHKLKRKRRIPLVHAAKDIDAVQKPYF